MGHRRDPKKRSAEKRIGAISVGVGATVALTSSLSILSRPANVQLYCSHLLVKDKPIDEIPIVFAHNANNYVGSGTLPVVSNQTMGVTELLGTTPVRGFELNVWEHNGQLVINHGGIFDPLVSQPVTLESTLGEINAWLDKPENKDEAVFIYIENHVQEEKLDSHLENILEGRLLSSLSSMPHSSIHDLVQTGIRVIQVPSLRDSAINEDRMFIAPFLRGIHPEIVPTIDTEKMDALVHSGKGEIIKLDQITPDDPRFFTPEDRARLDLKPSISLFHDSIHPGSGALSEAFFGAGVGLASGGIVFAFSSGLLQAYNNYKFLKTFPIEAEKTLNELTLSDFKKESVSPISPAELTSKVEKLLKNDITRKTIQPGLLSTLSISGGIFSLGLLFPPFFPFTSIASLGVLGIGVVATTVATWYHRRKVTKLAMKFFKENAELLDAKCSFLNSENALKASNMHLEKSSKVTDILLGVSLIANISARAKYALPFIGVVAGGVQAGLGFLRASYNAFTNYRDRQIRLKNLSTTLQEACDPEIFKKKYLFFGKSKLEQYILEHATEITSSIKGISNTETQKVDEIIKQLSNPINQPYFKEVVNYCKNQEKERDLAKYFKRKNIKTTGPDSENSLELGVQSYINDTVQKCIKRDVRSAGRINTLIVAGSIAALSIVAPPFGGFFLMAAVATTLIGLGVTELVAYHEQKKFQKSVYHTLNSKEDTIQTRACQLYYSELLSLSEALAFQTPSSNQSPYVAKNNTEPEKTGVKSSPRGWKAPLLFRKTQASTSDTSPSISAVEVDATAVPNANRTNINSSCKNHYRKF